jgi:hypothetical protein
MAFPQTPLDVDVELQLGGVWTDITSDVYLRNPITISRGRADEAARPDPAKCALTLNNRAGKYSPRNPTGAYYGQIGRNTPLRVSVPYGNSYLDLQADNDLGTTPDVAALDITGDIDIRLDATLENWLCGDAVILGGKYGVSGQRSWFLYVSTSGNLGIAWSTTGIGAAVAASTAQLPAPPSGRLAVRVTVDVDNGAGGYTITFYTSTSISGTWTQLGSTVVGVGVTSIFASTAALEVGDVTAGTISGAVGSLGHVHAFQLRSGIGGAIVANPDWTVQTSGATSFVDSAGRTWGLAGTARISNRLVRFTGEVSSWPARWDVSGKDVYVPIEASGITRRLGQGASPLNSALRRAADAERPIAYWPMEDGDDATSAASAVPGVAALDGPLFDWASRDDLAGSSSLPAVSGTMTGTVPVSSPSTLEWEVDVVVRVDTAPAAGSQQQLLSILTTGTVARWTIADDATNFTLTGTSSTGTALVSQTLAHASNPGFHGAWVAIKLHAVNSGINTDWEVFWRPLDPAVAVTYGTSGTVAAAVGSVTGISTTFGSGLGTANMGHLAVFDHETTTYVDLTPNPALGWAGEDAGSRIIRLCQEEGIPALVTGSLPDQPDVGAQRPEALLSLLDGAAAAGGGILIDQRTILGLRYRDLISLYNQSAALALTYTTPGHVAPPLEPVDDDQATRNDVTVTRTGGSSARAVQSTGTLSVLAPPSGVGRYQESVTLNVATDAQLTDIAGWRLHLGTVDEARWPHVTVDLAAAPSLIPSATALDAGDRLTIAGLPAWLPPDTVSQIIQGYSEKIGLYEWELTFNCTPESPWRVGVLDDATLGRLDTGGSTLNAGATSTATSLSVASSGVLWTTTDTPFDIVIAGERMTVTAVSGAASPQTFTVTRSVNGVVKAQSSGAAVQLYQPMTLAL